MLRYLRPLFLVSLTVWLLACQSSQAPSPSVEEPTPDSEPAATTAPAPEASAPEEAPPAATNPDASGYPGPGGLGSASYPGPSAATVDPDYPAPAMPTLPSGYPVVPTATALPEGPKFTIDLPVRAGDRQVTGTGLADVPIRLVDVTETGRQLATTTVGSDGRFTFELAEALPAQHSIGIQIGDLEGTPFQPEEFIRSETYYDRPYVGILLDLVSVEE